MATVAAVMDRGSWGANTDNIVIANRRSKTLIWVPRDLWCESLGRKINRAFAYGGPAGLLAALAEHGIEASEVLCLRREAVETALASVSVTVTVAREMAFWYPLAPELRLQDGRKLVTFRPPAETLRGERIHQWLGARSVAQTPDPGARRAGPLASLRRMAIRRRPRLPDLDRIERQKIFVRELLRTGFDFSAALANSEWVACTSEAALEELHSVDAEWDLRTLGGLEPCAAYGQQFLVRIEPSRLRRFAARVLARR